VREFCNVRKTNRIIYDDDPALSCTLHSLASVLSRDQNLKISLVSNKIISFENTMPLRKKRVPIFRFFA
jgi:hypothetical protein